MNLKALPGRISRFARKARELGLREALRQALFRLVVRPQELLPLARVNPVSLLTTDTAGIHAQEKQQIRASSLLFDASRVEDSYPNVHEQDGRFLRYAFLPAAGVSRGLVVLFHGHDAFLHQGPIRQWRDFDLLAPWDTFGWKRQGSWFWGEKGSASVAPLIQALIAKHRAPDAPLFLTGSSMGGFGALYHGLTHGCDGMYVMCPQVDIPAKIAQYGGADNRDNPYGHLQGSGPDGLPDPVKAAEARDSLPPLFLIQNQYDHVNQFADHAWKLLEVYNRKRGWYGLRIHPAIGHGGDGKQEEAEMFFALLLDRHPAWRVDSAEACAPASPL